MNRKPESDHESEVAEAAARIEARWDRWKGPLAKVGCLLLVPIFYVFVYPVIFFIVDTRSPPEWLEDPMYFSVMPLETLDSEVEIYSDYIDWLEDRIEK